MLIPSNRTKRECILSRLCFLVLSVWVSLPSAAQNNPYKIDDALYPIYQRASKQARQQEGLLVADTLYQQALKLGDKKARLVSYNNHHDPMDLPLAAVNAMAIVKFSIRKNMMM